MWRPTLAALIAATSLVGCRRWDSTCEPESIWSIDLVSDREQPAYDAAWRTDGADLIAVALGTRSAAQIELAGAPSSSPIIAFVSAHGQIVASSPVAGDPASQLGEVPSAIGFDAAGDVVVAWGIPSCLVTHYAHDTFTADWSVRDPTVNTGYLRCQGLVVSAAGETAYATFDQRTTAWAVTLLEPDGSPRWTQPLRPLPSEAFYFARLEFLPGGDVLVGSPTLGEVRLAAASGQIVTGPSAMSRFATRDGAIATFASGSITMVDASGNTSWSSAAPLKPTGAMSFTPAGDLLIGGVVPAGSTLGVHEGYDAVALLAGDTGEVVAAEERCNYVELEAVDGGYIELDQTGNSATSAQLALHPMPSARPR